MPVGGLKKGRREKKDPMRLICRLQEPILRQLLMCSTCFFFFFCSCHSDGQEDEEAGERVSLLEDSL